jgi:hypothetical protein
MGRCVHRRKVLLLMRKRYSLLPLLLLLVATGARAQDAGTPPLTKTSKFLAHFDFGLSGIALFTKDSNGTVTTGAANVPYSFTQTVSTTAGGVITLRGSKSPYVGAELNYGFGRVTEAYTCCNVNVSTGLYSGNPFQVQVGMNEFTLGYLVKPPHHLLGTQPYISAGAGTIVFAPTRNGGVGLQKQARATYYYTAGLEKMIVGDLLGIRAGIRQNFYLGPDFDQPYLRIKARTFTTEPQFGLFVKF